MTDDLDQPSTIQSLDEFMRGYLAEHPDANMPAWRERQTALALAAADALADAVRGIGPLALEDALAAYREARERPGGNYRAPANWSAEGKGCPNCYVLIRKSEWVTHQRTCGARSEA